MEMCRLPASFRRASLPSRGNTMRCVCRFAPVGPGRQTAGQGCIIRSPRPETCAWKRSGSPRFLGNPLCLCPVLRPGRTDASGLLDTPDAAPCRQRRRLQARGHFGAPSHGFGTGCLRFVRWVSPPGRKTRFWVLAKLSQAGLSTRRIPTRGFNGFLHHLPLSQARLAQCLSPLCA